MTTEDPLRIEDARLMRELGMPLNMPVVDREWSETAGNLFVEATNAKTTFYWAFADHCKAPAPTKRLFNRMRKALDKLIGIGNQVADFTSPDENEAWAMQGLLTSAIAPFVAYWQEALTSIEEGEGFSITITREMFKCWAIP